MFEVIIFIFIPVLIVTTFLAAITVTRVILTIYNIYCFLSKKVSK